MYDQAPPYLCHKFEQIRNQIHNTRNNEKLDIPKYRTSSGQRSFKYRGTKTWNALDNERKSINNLNIFKKKLKSSQVT